MTQSPTKHVPPQPNAQEKSRQDFVVSLRRYGTQVLGGGNYDVYKNHVEPKFERAHGHKPQTAADVRKAMTENSYYQFWSAVQRSSQEMVWDSVIDTAERTLPALKAEASQSQRLGSIRLAPDMEIPKYQDAYDIHLMPGGYHGEQSSDDVTAGLVYDMGVPIYSLRAMGEMNDSTGLTVLNGYETLYPGVQPQRVLDLGCAIGNSTMPWAEAFPRADVHGIDIGAPCLRYGHLRANGFGQALHLSQQNAEQTDFPDNHFDVVASTLLFHETSTAAVPRIFKEIMRILKPGGVMIHLDGFDLSHKEPIVEFLNQWEIHNNNENFLLTLQSIDVEALSKQTGFKAVRFETMPFIKTATLDTSTGKKGYMASGDGFSSINLLVAEKPA